MSKTVLYQPTIKSALGIYTGDLITTSYNTGPYIIHHVHGPITSFTGVGYLVILDHPEISLTLSTPNAKRKGTGGYINNIRQVNDRWYTAQNNEIFITRPYQAPAAPTTLFDLMKPPHEVDFLPTPPPYQFNPCVDYDAGPRRTWHCDDCHVDFNATPSNRYWCRHDCQHQSIAKEVFYVRAPQPNDRRPYISYYVMTLNSDRYAPQQSPTTFLLPQTYSHVTEAPTKLL